MWKTCCVGSGGSEFKPDPEKIMDMMKQFCGTGDTASKDEKETDNEKTGNAVVNDRRK